MKLIQSTIVLGLFSLVFACGVASRNLLGDWISSLVLMSPPQQFYSVFSAVFGVLTATASVCLNLILFAVIVFLTVAFLQEMYYQFFVRKVFSLLMKELRPSEQTPIREKSPRENAEKLASIRRQKEFEEAKKFAEKIKAKRNGLYAQDATPGMERNGDDDFEGSEGKAEEDNPPSSKESGETPRKK